MFCGGAEVEPEAAAALPDLEVVVEAGGVAGSATPLGQCQWSPWGEQVEAAAGGVVGLDTPLGQCQ